MDALKGDVICNLMDNNRRQVKSGFKFTFWS